MELMLVVALLVVLPAGSSEDLVDHCGHETRKYYSNEWLVRLEGGPQVAELLATQLGYTFAGPVVGFPDTYRMLKSDHPPLLKRGYSRLTQRLVRDTRVVWAEQQFPKQRVKRGMIPPTDGRAHRSKRGDLPVPRVQRLFNDELWDQQWYMQDTRTRPDLPKLDLHVLPVYRLGLTGRGVRVVVLDDGLEYTHQDLRANYDPEISYDANDNDEDPLPRYDGGYSNSHGTRCAGEIAMVANNRKCGVGIAFNSRIGGIRLLDGSVNDRVEGTALGYAYDKVDIYSASWGPNDDGMTVEGPGRLAQEAIERGIKEGRGGKGCIFVWASGNGGSREDNCNCDGYIGNIYTLSMSSASQQGQFPWYGERCASTMAATYSSGAYSDQMIATTDLMNRCTVRHTGTSASAPLAAGIIALALEANPELTWRDVQHLVTWTAEYAPLNDNLGWVRNAAGFWINTRFGFGLMNAHGLVTAAINWTNVPPQVTCRVPAEPMTNLTFEHGKLASVKFVNKGSPQEIQYLEHVQLEANIAYPVRGVLEIHLTSAAGADKFLYEKSTKVQLLSPRKFDQSNMGFINWRFMSVLTWGESPAGTWTLEIIDKVGKPGYQGELGQFTLILHGTKEQPEHLKNGPRRYNEHYNRMHRKMAQETVTTIEEMEAQTNVLDWNDIVGVPIELQRSNLSKSKLREWILKLLGLGDD